MFDRFAHYLSYGSTDQATMRELWAGFSGLLVPATIAAFQAEGTRGFVLSLSAGTSVPYAIDSRFPLFQNRLVAPKRSHLMLAEIFGDSSLVKTDRAPTPGDFSEQAVRSIAQNWFDFNSAFEDVQLKTFNKYARRLGEEPSIENKDEPELILAPYLMAREEDEDWWEVSNRLFEATVSAAAGSPYAGRVRRTVAVESARQLEALLRGIEESEATVWVSNLDEFRPVSESDLIDYGRAIRAAAAEGKRLFALYGGFFAVLLGRYGLVGASHGIGFGEHRDWVELPTSGAPPARFYAPRLHRYVSVDVAMAVWTQFPQLMTCNCAECAGRPPGSLNYHELMKHSVRVRTQEIADWLDMPTATVRERFTAEIIAFRQAADELRAPQSVVRRAEEIFMHLPMWLRVLDAIDA
jgi:hypothetical protein